MIVAAVDLLPAGRLDVGRGPLEDALEAEGLLGRRLASVGQPFLVLAEPGAQLALQALHVSAAREDHLGDRLVVEQRGQHVLDADELVPLGAGVTDREAETRLEGTAEPH